MKSCLSLVKCDKKVKVKEWGKMPTTQNGWACGHLVFAGEHKSALTIDANFSEWIEVHLVFAGQHIENLA